MMFPEKAKVLRREGGVIEATCFKGTLLIFPQEPNAAKMSIQVLQGSQDCQSPNRSVERVEFGDVKGVKSVSRITNVGMQFCYILEVPGGYVQLDFSQQGAIEACNEAELEKYVHTIRVRPVS